MAVKIRLSRFGKTGVPSYRLVAIDEAKKRDGRAIEVLGSYNPRALKNKLEFKKDRVAYWVSVGAKPTQTIAALLHKAKS